MKEKVRFLGLDVHAETIAVAVAAVNDNVLCHRQMQAFWPRIEIWPPNRRRSKEPLPMPATKPSLKPASPSPILTIPELEHAKSAALGTLVSLHSRRAYKNAIDKFILVLLRASAWFQPRSRVAISLVPRITLIVSCYDQPSSLRDPSSSR